MKFTLAILAAIATLNPLSYEAARADDAQNDQKVYLDVEQIDEDNGKVVVELPEGVFEATLICKDENGIFVYLEDLKPIVDAAIEEIEVIIDEVEDAVKAAANAGKDLIDSII